jgi:hypothetical protein
VQRRRTRRHGLERRAPVEARGRRPGRVEAVPRHAVPVDLGQGQGGRVVGVDRIGEHDAVVEQRLPEPPAEPVRRQPAEEPHGLLEPADGAGRVERPAAGMGRQRAVGRGDEVDERLARDHDRTVHVGLHLRAGRGTRNDSGGGVRPGGTWPSDRTPPPASLVHAASVSR